MKCKKCPYCQVRNPDLIVCSYDHTRVDTKAYNKNKTMNCQMTDKEDAEFYEDYILWKISKTFF